MKDDIIKSQDFDLEMLSAKLDMSHLVYYLLMRRFEFEQSYIDRNRIEIERKFNNRRPNKKRIDKFATCNRDLPICINDKEDATNYHILRVLERPEIIDDYFNGDMRGNNNMSNTSKLKNKCELYKDLLIERMLHYCKARSIKKYNNSYTASHPLFNEINSNERKNSNALCKYLQVN